MALQERLVYQQESGWAKHPAKRVEQLVRCASSPKSAALAAAEITTNWSWSHKSWQRPAPCHGQYGWDFSMFHRLNWDLRHSWLHQLLERKKWLGCASWRLTINHSSNISEPSPNSHYELISGWLPSTTTIMYQSFTIS